MLERDPPPGVSAWLVEGRLNHVEAQVQGPPGTVYEEGVFKLEIHIPDRCSPLHSGKIPVQGIRRHHKNII